MKPEEVRHYEDLLEPDDIPLWGLRLVWKLDAAGEQGLYYTSDGERRIAAIVLGALEAVKYEIWKELMESDD